MRSRPMWLAGIAALVAAAAVAATAVIARAAPEATPANEVTKWNAIAANTLVAFPGPAGGAGNAIQIHLAMTQGAVYDAVNATEPRHHRPYLLKRRFAATASKEAAVAAAAYRVLSNIVATVPERIPFPNRASLLQSLAEQYATSLAAIPETPFKTQGIAAGNAAAEAMIAARENDGRFGPSPWVPNPAPGHWQPLLNPDGTQMLDPAPWVANVRPFLIESSSQFRTDGPQALNSAAYAAEFNEVKALGGDGVVTPTARTPEQTHIALFWQSAGGATLLWNGVERSLVDSGILGADIVDSARLFAMTNLTGADAGINCWNDKYYWDFWRPWNAIRRAAEDDNPATEPDPTWTALLTAPYPDHPSGHLCFDGAHLRVLQVFFGTNEIGFDVTSSSFPGEPRHFDRFSEPLGEIIEARIWAGLHFRTADVQAQILGRNIADYMANNYFQPVGRVDSARMDESR
jgi:hypothetical protein